jgi:hypothetical protein
MAAPLARYYARRVSPIARRSFYDRALGHAPARFRPRCSSSSRSSRRRRATARGDGAVQRVPHAGAARRAGRPGTVERGQLRLPAGPPGATGGRVHLALAHLQTMLDLGVPQNLMDQAWFERGEALLEIGRDDALDAYRPGPGDGAARRPARRSGAPADRPAALRSGTVPIDHGIAPPPSDRLTAYDTKRAPAASGRYDAPDLSRRNDMRRIRRYLVLPMLGLLFSACASSGPAVTGMDADELFLYGMEQLRNATGRRRPRVRTVHVRVQRAARERPRRASGWARRTWAGGSG